MKSYTSCFLGIPLPQEYLREFEQLLDDIHSLDFSIETVLPQTPHVTICYLNRQSQYSLEEINKKIQPFTESLNEIKLRIGGFGYFTEDNSRVLFLHVTYPKALIEYKNKVSEALREFSGIDNSLSFHPHMTIGRIKNALTQQSFKKNEEKLSLRLNSIHWDFKINEIVIYGVDSTKSPELQEKLLTILI